MATQPAKRSHTIAALIIYTVVNTALAVSVITTSGDLRPVWIISFLYLVEVITTLRTSRWLTRPATSEKETASPTEQARTLEAWYALGYISRNEAVAIRNLFTAYKATYTLSELNTILSVVRTEIARDHMGLTYSSNPTFFDPSQGRHRSLQEMCNEAASYQIGKEHPMETKRQEIARAARAFVAGIRGTLIYHDDVCARTELSTSSTPYGNPMAAQTYNTYAEHVITIEAGTSLTGYAMDKAGGSGKSADAALLRALATLLEHEEEAEQSAEAAKARDKRRRLQDRLKGARRDAERAAEEIKSIEADLEKLPVSGY